MGHSLCSEVHGNLSEINGTVVLMAQAGVTAYAKRVTLVDNCLETHSVLLITLLGNATTVHLNEITQKWKRKTASRAQNNQPHVELFIG